MSKRAQRKERQEKRVEALKTQLINAYKNSLKEVGFSHNKAVEAMQKEAEKIADITPPQEIDTVWQALRRAVNFLQKMLDNAVRGEQ